MSIFADSSALVKLYADEAGHHQIRALSGLVIAELARVEVPAALWRKHRMRELSSEDVRILVAAFEADYFGADGEAPRFVAVATVPQILDEAARLVAVHGLRAYDAVQLATARAVAGVDPQCRRFAAFDAGLRTAAATEGFDLVPSARDA